MANKTENTRLLISLGIAGALIVGLLWLVSEFSRSLSPSNTTQGAIKRQPINNSSSSVRSSMSLGDKILVTADTNPHKQAGVEAFAQGDYVAAVEKFQSSLKTHQNDPETLIYLNNARVYLNNPNGKSLAIKIAVSVPIGGVLDLAKETLRGVAQAQDEVNRNGGINGTPLQLQIANTDGNREKIKQLDLEFINDPRILAVVGYSPDVSTYNQGGLVRISPVNPVKLSEKAKYVFYTMPSPGIFADALARYIVQDSRLKNIAICNDSTSPAGQATIKATLEEYTDYIRQAGGKVSSTVCDLGAQDFNPSNFMSRAISDGVEGLLLIPRVDKFNSVIDLIKENKGKLPLFASSQMYTRKTLQLGQADTKTMVLSVPWHPNAIADNSFANKANKLWGGQVNARTAMAYDSLKVIVAGFKDGNFTRDGLQKALAKPDFSATGATGKIQFLPSGDRKGGVFLVKVESGNISGTGYDFKLLR
jgi:branched-chain amino acid transport system substrate-binding protein